MLQAKEICETAKDHLKGKTTRDKSFKANIENAISILHYRVTVVFLLTFTVVITCFEYIEKISCIRSKGSKVPVRIINTYCFIQTTFTLPKDFKLYHEEEAVLPGVGTYKMANDETKYHAYYQWVPFVLFLQAMMFYFPHLVLKYWNGDKLRKIVGMHINCIEMI